MLLFKKKESNDSNTHMDQRRIRNQYAESFRIEWWFFFLLCWNCACLWIRDRERERKKTFKIKHSKFWIHGEASRHNERASNDKKTSTFFSLKNYSTLLNFWFSPKNKKKKQLSAIERFILFFITEYRCLCVCVCLV